MTERPVHAFEVIRTEKLTPHMIRIVLGGDGFDTFVPSDATDAYVKILFFPTAIDTAELQLPLTMNSFAELPAENRPVIRTYTVRYADPVNRQIAIDFVTHGDLGVAGAWAGRATPGEPVYLMGPSGGYTPDANADWHLLAGDESAIPAISAAVAALPAAAIGQVFIEVTGPDDELPLPTPDGVQVQWIHRGGRADLVPESQAGDNAPLMAAVRNAPWLPGRPQVFIHGEAQTVMHNLRSYILKERGVDAKSASISGYWRRGRTEEGFRQWKQDLASAENH
ncbi:siderophore-interacting protein [Mycobacterium sp. MYCO198283]|uniref:siderophore-interacting protein n=1 Tax=Mycobacterium sp. MYCO198283 TaxID=2883505 RepID=UPI001E52BF85|nr:siderophore-interacting protein [Mycobacterium sp. MYCO198283]MCG5432160.1 siderophore-interacting protein [Mycobacterium sp. MYCO198283]